MIKRKELVYVYDFITKKWNQDSFRNLKKHDVFEIPKAYLGKQIYKRIRLLVTCIEPDGTIAAVTGSNDVLLDRIGRTINGA